MSGFLKQSGLPFADVLTAEMIEAVVRKHDGLFGMRSIYGTATVLWAFLSQVLRDGKMAACQSAVASIITHRQLLGLETPTNDTGDYCRARAKLNEDALRELASAVAQNANRKLVKRGLLRRVMLNSSMDLPSLCQTTQEARKGCQARVRHRFG